MLAALYLSTPKKAFVTLGESRIAGSKPMQEYTMLIGLVHVALDGIGAHMIQQQALELLGGHSSSKSNGPRSEEELFSILSSHWRSRFGGKEPVWVFPPSLEDRMSTPNTRREISLAAEDLANQPQSVVSQSSPFC